VPVGVQALGRAFNEAAGQRSGVRPP
jgi:hypothetical protein